MTKSGRQQGHFLKHIQICLNVPVRKLSAGEPSWVVGTQCAGGEILKQVSVYGVTAAG